MVLRSLLAGLLVLACAPLSAGDPSDARKGRIAFVRCMACHSIVAGEPHKVGPNLHGVLGAAAARAEGFAYSEPLRKANLIWDHDTLRRWIEDPGALAPGTSMAYVNTLGAAEIEALIAFLETEGNK